MGRQPHLGEHGHVEAERHRVEIGMVTLDEARLLEGADAPQARRRRNPDAARQLDVGHATVCLQIVQDFAVDLIELDPIHADTVCGTRASRNNISIV